MQQQLHATTETQHEQTLSYAPAESALPAEHATTQTEIKVETLLEQSEEVRKLLAALEQDTRRRRNWNQFTVAASALVSLGFWIVWGILWLLSKPAAGTWGDHLLSIYFVSVLGWAVGSLFLNRKAAAALTTLDDVRCVGALVDIWGEQGAINHSARTRRKARLALTRLLPRLKASDAPLLKEAQRAVLRSALTGKEYSGYGKHYDDEFILSILKATEQVGDWRSLSAVKALSQDTKRPIVQTVALECLPYLQALAEKQKPGENLLRASSASEAANAAPATLLRPVLGADETRPDTLLRASEE